MNKKPLLASVASLTVALAPFAGVPNGWQTGLDGTASASPSIRHQACDDTLKSAFRPNSETRVVLVKAFLAGQDLSLGGKPSGILAKRSLCLVKLNVGPGNRGPAGAPSTSPGIGIDIWLPAQGDWTGRVRVIGGGGFAGSSADPLASTNARAGETAALGGWVTASTDTGHVGTAFDGSFAMNPDGSINERLWTDFSSRAVHETAVQTKALAALYYGLPVRYSYWDGCSTGGRQGLKEAQAYPRDFDGILAGAPAINWSRFITGELYPQVVMRRDLGEVMKPTQFSLVSAAAVSACDTQLNGEHDGFVTNPGLCRYDPTRDPQVLCKADGGQNETAACVSPKQARAINKMWYGQTSDGSVPDPAVANGYAPQLRKDQLWYGLSRGTLLVVLAGSRDGHPAPFGIASMQVALEMQDGSLADGFRNAQTKATGRWIALSYADLARAQRLGRTLQPRFGHIDTDDADLQRFRAHGSKLLHYHGLSDQLIPSQGSMNYYTRVADKLGGISAVQSFYRYYEIPAMGHCGGIGSVNGSPGVSPAANPPLPGPDQMFNALVAWVEKGQVPERIVLESPDKRQARPICPYPERPVYTGGDRSAAASYRCQK